MAPLVLTARDVALAALPLYREGKLQGQVEGVKHGCFYRGPSSNAPCAIGAAMPDDFIARLQTAVIDGISMGVRKLIDKGLLETPDRHTLAHLQELHDGGSFQQLGRELALIAEGE